MVLFIRSINSSYRRGGGPPRTAIGFDGRWWGAGPRDWPLSLDINIEFLSAMTSWMGASPSAQVPPRKRDGHLVLVVPLQRAGDSPAWSLRDWPAVRYPRARETLAPCIQISSALPPTHTTTRSPAHPLPSTLIVSLCEKNHSNAKFHSTQRVISLSSAHRSQAIATRNLTY